jgi:imidazolonepropionase
MSYLAIINIEKLYTGSGEVYEHCSLLIENDSIKEVHFDRNFDHHLDKEQIIDAKNSIVTPGLIDGHTHPVFDGSRAFELDYKLAGMSYSEITEKGGGINFTTLKTRNASREQLKRNLMSFCDNILSHGTTTVEVKSGYHLEPEGELLALEIIQEVNKEHSVELIPTFLGAHLVAPEYKKDPDVYVNILLDMMSEVKSQGIARFTDVFCDKGAFTVEQTFELIDSSIKYGLPVRIHGEEIERTGIAEQSAKKYTGKWIKSVDHLLKATEDDFRVLAENSVTATFMPIAPVVLFEHKWHSYNILKNSMVNIGLGSDFNPNSWFLSMQNVMSFATYFMKIPPLVALESATKNNAQSLQLDNTGVIMENKRADLVLFHVSDINEISYQIGANNVNKVIKEGKLVIDRGVEGK